MGYQAYQTVAEYGEASRTSPTATVVVIVPLSDLVTSVSSWIGGYQYVNGSFQYSAPVAYARNPGLFAQRIEFKPLGDAVDPVKLDFDPWVITIHFGYPDQPNGEDVARTTNRTGGEELVLSKSAFQIGGQALKDSDPTPVKIVPLIETTLSFANRPTVDPLTWSNFVGAINLDPFLGFPAETIMFNSCDTNYTVAADGTPSNSVDYLFTCRPTGWNKIWRPGSGWQTVTPDIYDIKLDFSLLAAGL